MTQDAGLPARKAALGLVHEVLARRKPLNGDAAALKSLPPRDAGFARALASQTIRHFGALDAVLRGFVSKPLAHQKAGPTAEILLLGAAELLILEGAPHAAVDAANRLAAADAKAVHFKPLINAVLRRVAYEGASALAALDAARLSTPDWLWQRWCAQYGEETTRAIADAHRHEAPLDIALKTEAVRHPESKHLFGLSGRVAQGGRIEEMAGFSEGGWWVQDVAASLPALLLGDVRGRTVIDLCAAPGGKTMQLAAAGAHVIAVDREPARLARVGENLARTGLSAQLIESDARDVDLRAPFVLIDAPCTATGTIRRHPDLPWIKQAADLTMAAAAAYEILECGARLVEPGGMLVFAVCSLEREEGEDQVSAFLSGHREFTHLPVAAGEVFGQCEWISPQGDLRTLPCHLAGQGGMDGFYAARLKRVS